MSLELFLSCALTLVERIFGLLLNGPVCLLLVHDIEGFYHFDGADFAALKFFGEVVADEHHALIQLLSFLRLLKDDGIELSVSFEENTPPPSLDDSGFAGDVSLHNLHISTAISLFLLVFTQLLVRLLVVYELRAPSLGFLELRAAVVNNLRFLDVLRDLFVGVDFEVEQVGVLSSQLNEVILEQDILLRL